MLRKLSPIALRVKHTACYEPTKATLPVIPETDAKRIPIDQVMGIAQPKVNAIQTTEDPGKGVISGVPEEHQSERTARIYKPAREATQSGWNNTKYWRIELDNRGRWENSLMGWASSGDPLSNVSMHMKFGSKEDAIAFCEKNNWAFEVEDPQQRHITPKSYGSIYSWNKRFRVSTK